MKYEFFEARGVAALRVVSIVFQCSSPRHRGKNTIARAERAMAKLGEDEPFLLVYPGSDAPGGGQRLNAPLRTVTTLDRFASVRRNRHGHEMRMLQVPELKGVTRIAGPPWDPPWLRGALG